MESDILGVSTAARKRGLLPFVVAAVAALFAAVGGYSLFVPWLPPSTPYGACHAGLKVWLGCVAGLSHWLPFALLFGGLGVAMATILLLRRR